jgi:hypothetical protein
MLKYVPLLLLAACASAPKLESVQYRTLPQLQAVLDTEKVGERTYTLADCERPIYKRDDADMWLTPKQFTERGAGDCEDYALCYFYVFSQRGQKPWLLVTKNHAATLVGNKVYDMGKVHNMASWSRVKQPLLMANEDSTFYFKGEGR